MKQFFTLFFVLVGLLTQAQTGILTGRILDDSDLPLIGAAIQVEGLGGTVSDVDGNYFLNNIPAGTYTAEVSYIGYDNQIFEFTIDRGVVEQNIKLSAGVTLSQVVISGNLAGQAKALNKQLTNKNITNVISADQVGKFPDSNIGDAMKRIPGINVQYDQGEARFGNIRGTAPELSSVMINGERVPSAEAEIRSVQLDLVPSDMIQSVEVSKAVTPDMDADAIGGAVNLITRAAPSQQRISVSAGTGYNLIAEKPSSNFSVVYGNRFADDKVGIILSSSLFNNLLGSDNVEAEWGGDASSPELKELQVRQYYLQRLRKSVSATFDFKLAPTHTIFLKGMYNQRNDWENRYRAVYKDLDVESGKAVIERQTKAGVKENKWGRLEDQDVLNLSLSGNHIFGKLSMDWGMNYAKASEERPHERYFQYITPKDDDTAADIEEWADVTLDITNTRKPKVNVKEAKFQGPSDSWKIDEILEEYQYTKDEDVNGKLNFALPLTTGENASVIKFGGRLRTKTKKRDNDSYEFGAEDEDAVFANSLANLTDFNKSNYLAGNYSVGSFVDRTFIGKLDLDNTDLFEKEQKLSDLAGNFNASEKIYAGYLMLEQNIGQDLFVIVGGRVESTNNKYKGFEYNDDDETLTETQEVKSDYTDFLPGIHIKYNVSPKTIVRAAWTNTIARPNYIDLVPRLEIEDNEAVIGNPALNPTRAMNFDLMAEHYFGTIGLVSAGVFYKDIKDFLTDTDLDPATYSGVTYDKLTQKINGGDASLLGLEVAFQRQLDIISPALKNLGLYMNYTFTNSEIKNFNIEDREEEDLSLPGSPEHTLNASLSYEGKKFTARLSYNFASEFISEFGGEKFEDIYYDSVNYLDFNFNYSINKNFNLYFNVNNILNQPLRFYQGEKDFTFQEEYYNMRFDIGIKYDLFGSK